MQLLTSTCNHRSYLSQISAIGLIGSNAPNTVVPHVQFTKNGLFFCSIASLTRRSNSDGSIRPLKCKKNK